MTLLITVLTKEAIHQSADFRLTDLDGGGILTETSTKLVSLQYEHWHGFVSYTGIGRWAGKDTSEFLINWLSDGQFFAPQDLENRIADCGTTWLRNIEKQWQRPRHTFVVASFSGGEPIVSVISNFQYCSGKTFPVASSLSISRTNFHGRPIIIVCGAVNAVSTAQRRQLKSALRVGSSDTARIRRMLKQLNAAGSRTHASKGTISLNCSAFSVRADGRGVADIDDNVEMLSLCQGVRLPDAKTIFAQIGVEPGRLIGAAFVSSNDQVPFPSCKPHTVTPAETIKYDLSEITHPDLGSMQCVDVSDNGSILGEGIHADQFPRLWKSAVSESLVISTFRGRAGGINDHGAVAATLITTENFERAVRLDKGSLIDLGVLKGKDSGASAINSSGLTAGWVGINPSSRGQAHFRPAAGNEKMQVIENMPFDCDWGQAVDVNDGAQILIVAYRGWTCHALIWNLKSVSIRMIGGMQGVFPNSITRDGSVLGTGRDDQGETVAYIAKPNANWEKLGAPPGYYATSMNDAGDVVGACKRDGYEKPWLRCASGEIVWLPYYRDHWCRPIAINSSKLIVGSAQTDHGYHALVWRPVVNNL